MPLWAAGLCLLALSLGTHAAFAGQRVSSLTIASNNDHCGAVAREDFSTLPDAPTQVLSAEPALALDGRLSYCRVRGYVGASIGIELALPDEWNGRFVEGGCGGHCGTTELFFSRGCDNALRAGFACLVSDMGHRGNTTDALWASNNLQGKLDWGFRATHVVALAGKSIAGWYYHQAPARSYFIGCSTGGRQGLQEAQHYPADFDGIVAGAPPVNLSQVYETFIWAIRATHDAQGAPLLSQKDLERISHRVEAKCASAGEAPGHGVSDPLHCHVDPGEWTCPSNRGSDCLTTAQVDSIRRVYRGPVSSSGNALTSGGPLPGSEAGWSLAYVGKDDAPPGAEGLVLNALRYLFLSPEPGDSWHLSDFDFDRDPERMASMEVLVDASNPDLRRFEARGGKLLIYQGANDTSVLPRSTIDYYETVERTMGGREATQKFLRLFLLPGVEHCFGGPGADTVDFLSYLQRWREEGVAPDRLLVAHLKKPPQLTQAARFPLSPDSIAFTRPAYPYPTRAKFTGAGDPNDAANFEPVEP